MHLCVVKVFGCLTVYSGSRLKIEKKIDRKVDKVWNPYFIDFPYKGC